ncbi:MAG: hypothetical protein U0792_19425 [Gemmataceae bacterium]
MRCKLARPARSVISSPAPRHRWLAALGANEKIRLAGIGIGGKGSSDIDQAGGLMEVVAAVRHR